MPRRPLARQPSHFARARGYLPYVSTGGGIAVAVVLVLSSLGWAPSSHPQLPTRGGLEEVDPEFLPVTYSSPVLTPEGLFGKSVALSGQTVAVAAPGDEGRVFGPESPPVYGCVYEFHTSNSSVVTICDHSSRANQSFGASIALGGTWLAVGDPHANLSFVGGPGGPEVTAISGGGEVFVYRASTGALESVLTSPNAAENGSFGASVAISDGLLVVGAPGESQYGAAGGGHAYVFNLADNSSRTLTSPIPQSAGAFGSAVGVSGNRVVVGAPGEVSSGYTGAGNAYVFNDVSGDLLQALNSSAPGTGRSFGTSVAVNGTNVAVGQASPLSSQPLVDVFDLATGTELNVSAPPSLSSDLFGRDVALNSAWLVVGSAREIPYGGAPPYSGAAYVYSAENGSLITSNLTSATPMPSGFFGTSVAAIGGEVLVGAPDEPIGGVSVGHAYLFTKIPLRYSSPHPIANGGYGQALSIDSDVIAIGAPRESVGPNAGAGQVELLSVESGPVQRIVAPLAYVNGSFGAAVVVTPNLLAVGAPGADEGAGAVYVYNLTNGVLDRLWRTYIGPTGFGASLALTGDTLVVGSPSNDSGTGAVTVLNLSSGQRSVLVRDGPPGSQFGASLAAWGNWVAIGEPGYNTGIGRVVLLNLTDNRTQGIYPSANVTKFGTSVALTATRIAVGAPGAVIQGKSGGEVALYALSAFSGSPSPGARLPIKTLVSPVGTSIGSRGYFGAAVALNSGTLAVGDPYSAAFGAASAGNVYLYSAATGTPVDRYNAPYPIAKAYFGGTVSLGPGGDLLVGPWITLSTADPGYAYLFFL